MSRSRRPIVTGALFLAILSLAGDVLAQGSQLPESEVPRPASQAASASSQEGPYRPARLHGYYRSGLAARVNPLGLFVSGTLQLRYRLFDSDSAILKDNYVAAGPILFISPAFLRAGVGVEVQPLSILQLSASYEFIGFFGNFEYNQSFPTATANSSDSELKRLKAAGQNYATYGGILTLAALFQIKLGPIAVRSNLRAFAYQMRLRAGDRVWYDSILDIVSPNNGWTLTNDTDLLYVTKFGFAAGARYTLTHSIFTAKDFNPGELEAGGNVMLTQSSPTHRLGPFFAYTFFDDERRKFNAPTVVLLAQWFLRHRYRTGLDISQAIPWFALAFQFKGII